MNPIRRTPAKLLRSASNLLQFRKQRPPVGASPGTLAPAPGALPPVIRVIRYDTEHVSERDVGDIAGLRDCREPGAVHWVDVQGLGDESVLRAIGDLFELHPLALEDAVNIPQRPKSESYERHHLFITRMTRLAEGQGLDTEQLSLFLGPGWVLTLQEHYGDVLDPVRKRVRAGKGLIRQQGADYLAYAIIDTVIDGYYPVVEALGDRLHELEEEILERPTHAGLQRIHRIRRELLALRRAVWPQREAVNAHDPRGVPARGRHGPRVPAGQPRPRRADRRRDRDLP